MGMKHAGVMCLWLGGCAVTGASPATDNPDPMFFTELIDVGDDGRCFAQASGQVTLADLRDSDLLRPPVDVVPAPAIEEEVQEDPVVLSPDAPVLFMTEVGDPFEAICADDLTPDFISSLQRALGARNAYSGQVTGAYDTSTAAAVLLYQRETLDLNSEVLALETAQSLGIAVLPASEIAPLF